MSILEQLEEMRSYGGPAVTTGLSDATLLKFAATHPELSAAVTDALKQHRALRAEFDHVLRMDEANQIEQVQQGLINFYATDVLNPYVALAARGPWIVTTKGAVIHDSGGYGMLGFGHAPEPLLEVMCQNHVMANVMTASFSQMRLIDALKREIGHSRGDQPFTQFLFLNSGSESVTVAARLREHSPMR